MGRLMLLRATTSPRVHAESGSPTLAIDFRPHRDQMKSGSNQPPRTLFLDDMAFYLQTHSSALDLAERNPPRVFAEKIVTCHYLKLAEFLQTAIEMNQFNLSRRKDMTSFAIAAVEEQWSDVQALARRIGEYKDDIEAIMLQLRIPFGSPSLKSTDDWRDSTADYQFMHWRFKEIGERVNSLNESTATLAGLTNNRQAVKAQELALEAAERSIREAKSVKALTILGFIFIPLAYVASLLACLIHIGQGKSCFGFISWLQFP
ncbi:hypothetical protein GGI43DRAFT_397036 [Trichoderma evansii]